MDEAEVRRELVVASAKLTDLRTALDRGVHRNELLVAARETIDDLTRLLDEEPAHKTTLSKLVDCYERLVVKLIN